MNNALYFIRGFAITLGSRGGNAKASPLRHPAKAKQKVTTMSLFNYLPTRRPANQRAHVHIVPAQRPFRVVVMPSDDEVKAMFARTKIIMKDAPIDVEAKVIGFTRTNAGSLGAILANQLSGRRELWSLDFTTRQPRFLALLA